MRLLAGILLAALTLTPVPASGGRAAECTVVGTHGDDRLVGTAGDDVICGRDGDDTISGGGGDDRLVGGEGRDTVSYEFAAEGVVMSLRTGVATGAGTDTLEGFEVALGSAKDDAIEGSPNADRLIGGKGDDELIGRRGDDRLFGGPGKDALEGDEDDDVLVGGSERDVLEGGTGTDGCLQGVEHGVKHHCEVDAYASADGLPLFPPSRSMIGFGYHESLFSSAIDLRPLGYVVKNDNGRFTAPSKTDGAGYVVMYSRGRSAGPTTATDNVVPSNSTVFSPVDGTVVTVVRYRLYCQSVDWKVVLEPTDRPTDRVLVLHMAKPSVKVGQHVQAVTSVLGVARDNDMASAQENEYFPDQYPHVHIEVERDGANPTPGCRL